MIIPKRFLPSLHHQCKDSIDSRVDTSLLRIHVCSRRGLALPWALPGVPC